MTTSSEASLIERLASAVPVDAPRDVREQAFAALRAELASAAPFARHRAEEAIRDFEALRQRHVLLAGEEALGR